MSDTNSMRSRYSSFPGSSRFSTFRMSRKRASNNSVAETDQSKIRWDNFNEKPFFHESYTTVENVRENMKDIIRLALSVNQISWILESYDRCLKLSIQLKRIIDKGGECRFESETFIRICNRYEALRCIIKYIGVTPGRNELSCLARQLDVVEINVGLASPGTQSENLIPRFPCDKFVFEAYVFPPLLKRRVELVLKLAQSIKIEIRNSWIEESIRKLEILLLDLSGTPKMLSTVPSCSEDDESTKLGFIDINHWFCAYKTILHKLDKNFTNQMAKNYVKSDSFENLRFVEISTPISRDLEDMGVVMNRKHLIDDMMSSHIVALYRQHADNLNDIAFVLTEIEAMKKNCLQMAPLAMAHGYKSDHHKQMNILFLKIVALKEIAAAIPRDVTDRPLNEFIDYHTDKYLNPLNKRSSGLLRRKRDICAVS